MRGGDTEKTLDIMDARQLTQIQFNPFNVANFANSWGVMIHDTIEAGHSDGTIKPDLAEEITTDGKVLTVRFPKGFKWLLDRHRELHRLETEKGQTDE
jgi:peptide/nickel transport system substrate-binding protein